MNPLSNHFRRCRIWRRVYQGGTYTNIILHPQALFHTWGYECGDGEGTCSIAIIELPDGKVTTCLPEAVEFFDPPDNLNPTSTINPLLEGQINGTL